MDDFLIDRDPQTWSASSGHPASLVPSHLFVQPVPGGLEIAVVTAPRKPTISELRAAWTARRHRRATPVLLVAFYPSPGAPGDERAALCGPVGEQPVVHLDVEVSQAERLAEVALREPSHHAATRRLLAALPELDSPIAGLRNSGLLATQELIAGVPMRADWASARTGSGRLLARRGRRLVEGLGYEIATLATNASVLTVAGRREAIAVFCDDSEPFEAPSDRFGGMSPVSRALALADRENVDWVLLTRASEIRLYSARPGVGVGRKGRAETFVELNLSLLAAEHAGYLALLFAAEAISTDGSLHQILSESERFAAALAERLRKRIYFDTVPALARAIAARLSDARPATARGAEITEAELDSAYEQVMVILFRLLFVAYAEDKDLLPYRSNSRYADHSLTRLAQRLAEAERNGTAAFDVRATDLWDDMAALWDAVNWGNDDWGVPAYNGGLFSDDPEISTTGAAIATLRLTNAEFGPALAAALVDNGPQGLGPVDFRSLSVREFGTIYEGLLESKLSVAADDLTVKQAKGADQYVPAGADDEVEVAAGEVYFGHRSGARKATGSYFTKPFAVEHLLDHALEPALDDHLARLDALRDTGDDAGVAAAFFDFRCADIAMGSAHFLVAAVDRIEARLSAWLSLHPVPAVTAELNRLRDAAMVSLGDLSDGVEIETGSLLRRQIARHCVYGVDKNRVAVELARLAIWVHTFVPGLPLSFLDHNFVHGDSLTGVGTLDEVVAAFEPDADPASPSMFRGQLVGLLEGAESALRRLARTSDASKHEIDEARAAHAEARAAVAGARATFDVVTAHRAGVCGLPENFDPAVVAKLAATPEVHHEITRLLPVHFPSAFPEVFLRESPGFDCLIGNPPWEQVVVQEHAWWGLHLPGIRALPVNKMHAEIKRFRALRPDLEAEFRVELEQAEQMRDLLRNKFSKMGSGRTDLYQAFAWANLSLTAVGGHLGLVLPYTGLQAAGMSDWRREIVGANSAIERERERERDPRITTAALINNKGWVFDGVHNSYTVVLAAVTRCLPSSDVSTPSSGRSTTSTAATPSRSSPLAGESSGQSHGGGFDAAPDESFIAIYPGPAASRQQFRRLVDGKPELIPAREFTSWSESASFPLLPSRAAFVVWRKMKRHPTLGAGSREPGAGSREPGAGVYDGGESGHCRATSTRPTTSTDSNSTVAQPPTPRTRRDQRQDTVHSRRWSVRPFAELHATADKERFTLDEGRAAMTVEPSGYWPVYKGASFDLWNPDTGNYYASVDACEISRHLQEKRQKQHRTASSPFSEFSTDHIEDPETLPCLMPRIAFRDVTNSTNTRTVVAALVPGEIVITNQAPYLLWPHGTPTDEAFVLGVLLSMVLDWYARRVVELHLNFHILNSLPLPDPGAGNPVRDRVAEVAGRLAAVDERFAEWAADVGVPVGSANDEITKQDLIHELDACVAYLYGLDEDDLEVIYTTFDEKRPDRYRDRLAAVLDHFRRLP